MYNKMYNINIRRTNVQVQCLFTCVCMYIREENPCVLSVNIYIYFIYMCVYFFVYARVSKQKRGDREGGPKKRKFGYR